MSISNIYLIFIILKNYSYLYYNQFTINYILSVFSNLKIMKLNKIKELNQYL